jgi:hypothetical protein
MRFLLLTIFLLSGLALSAQSAQPAPPKHSEWKPVSPVYQLYLDQPVQKIKKVEYLDGTPLKFDLGNDGETVHLLNYHKRGGVKVTAEDFNGQEVEVSRSPCVIDPVIQT